jgi:hypothetical protein
MNRVKGDAMNRVCTRVSGGDAMNRVCTRVSGGDAMNRVCTRVSVKESEKQQLYCVAYDVPTKVRFSDRYKIF